MNSRQLNPVRTMRTAARLRARWWAAALAVGLLLLVGTLGWQLGAFTVWGGSPSVPAAASAQEGALYLLTQRFTAPGVSSPIDGQLIVFDLARNQDRYAFEAVTDIAALVSPDRGRLYVAGEDVSAQGTGEDRLTAIDAQTGERLWQVALRDRVKYVGGSGPSSLAISPDGHWLYVYSYGLGNQYGTAGEVPFWLQIIDTSNGQIFPGVVPLGAGCGAGTLAIAPTGQTLSVTCSGTNDVRMVDLQTQRVVQQLSIPATSQRVAQRSGVVGSSASPDGKTTYVVTEDGRVMRVDPLDRTVVQSVDLQLPADQVVLSQATALSPDGSRLFVGTGAADGDGTISEIRVLSTSTWETIETHVLSQSLSGFAVDSTGTLIYGIQRVANQPDSVVRISPNGSEVLKSTQALTQVTGIILGP